MKKEEIISAITRNQSFDDIPEVEDWVKKTDENKAEYIRYKNLWALMQNGSNVTEKQVQNGLAKILASNKQKKLRYLYVNLLKYAATIVFAVMVGYVAGDWDVSKEVALNEVSVPKGSRTSIVLPDGTKVWLNNGSKLVYPEHFENSKRLVELSGEGFFDVTHDKKHPFIVKIGDNQIKVLGTKFALTAYPTDEIVKAELISGKIQFDVRKANGTDYYQSYILKPSQSLTLNKKSRKIINSVISDTFYNYWMNGVYEFKDETFESLANKIERIYNVEIVFENEALKKRLFTGSLSMDDNVYTMLEVFKHASGKPFSYTQDGNQIIIKH